MDERLLITFGVIVRGASLFMLGNLNLGMGMGNVMWPNIVNGSANGFLFVTLTTLLTCGEQRHQTYLAASLNATSPTYWNRVQRLTHYFAIQDGSATGMRAAMGLLYRNLRQQAMLMSYIDDFRLLACLCIACLPFLLFFRKGGRMEESAVEVHGE